MIDVIIPMYNSRNTIFDCINSVLKQTRIDLINAIIIVDDGSTDDCALYIKNVFCDENKIKLIRKENGGVSTARNVGIKASKAKWIALLDSDDIWLPEKIEKQWEMVSKYKKIQFIGCNRNNEKVHWGKRVRHDLYMLDLRHILIKTWPHTSTALIRREIFDEVGFFNENMRYAEDGDMWNRIACKYPLFYIPVSYEIAGSNKMQFGEKGLSANLKAMHEGNIRNIQVLRKDNNISCVFYLFLLNYNFIKYIRRIFTIKLKDAFLIRLKREC